MPIHHRNYTEGSTFTFGAVSAGGNMTTSGGYIDSGRALTPAPDVIPATEGRPHVGGDAGQQQEPDNVVELYPDCRTPGTVQGMRLRGSEAGMATAEYAIATLAAVGFAGLLVFILRSDEVRGFLLNLIRTALALP